MRAYDLYAQNINYHRFSYRLAMACRILTRLQGVVGVRTHPHPIGVTTPKKQSPESFSTTMSDRMGVMTMPALVSCNAATNVTIDDSTFISQVLN